MSAFQLRVVGSALIILLLDGMDAQMLGLLAPVILSDWMISKSALGPALAAALVGMALGSLYGGMIGDRIGRRGVLIGSTLVFGVSTALTSLSEGVWDMALLRLVAGIGFGAATPNAIALANDWVSLRQQSRVTAILSIGPPIGGMFGAMLIGLLLAKFDWRECFLLCGILTLITGLILAIGLPKGTKSGGTPDGIAPTTAPEGSAEISNAGAEPPARAKLLMRSNWRMNAGSWFAFFFISAVTYTNFNWAPTYLVSGGLTLSQALRALVGYNAAAIVMSLLVPIGLARFGSRRLLAAQLGIATAMIIAIGVILVTRHESAPTLATIAMTVLGGSVGSAMAAVYVLAAKGYPSELRATGLGAALAASRVGAITAVVASGYLLDLRADASVLHVALVGALLLAFLGTRIIDRHIPRDKPS